MDQSLDKQPNSLIINVTLYMLVHLDFEDCSEELLRQHSFAIKNQLVASKAPTRGFLLVPRWFFMA